MPLVKCEIVNSLIFLCFRQIVYFVMLLKSRAWCQNAVTPLLTKGLVQDCSHPSALSVELLPSCTSHRNVDFHFLPPEFLVRLIPIWTHCWPLTHWGRVTHICVGTNTNIGSDNGLSPGRRQAIIWTNAGILLIGPLATNFSEILIEILAFSFKKICLNVSSVKRRPSCLGLNVLNEWVW